MENKIIEFFKERNVRPYFIREFMRFLIENKAYDTFIIELSQFLNNAMPNSEYTIESWRSWSEYNLYGLEDRIIDKFFIWSATSNEVLWCDLHVAWAERFSTIKDNTYGTCYESHSNREVER